MVERFYRARDEQQRERRTVAVEQQAQAQEPKPAQEPEKLGWLTLSSEIYRHISPLQTKRPIQPLPKSVVLTPQNRHTGLDDLYPDLRVHHDRRAVTLTNGMVLSLQIDYDQVGYYPHIYTLYDKPAPANASTPHGYALASFRVQGVYACCGAAFVSSFSGGRDGTVRSYNQWAAALLNAVRRYWMEDGHKMGMLSAILNGTQRGGGWGEVLVKAGFPARHGFRNTRYTGHAALTHHIALAEEMDVPAYCREPADWGDSDQHPVPGLPRGPEEGQGVLGNPA